MFPSDTGGSLVCPRPGGAVPRLLRVSPGAPPLHQVFLRDLKQFELRGDLFGYGSPYPSVPGPDGTLVDLGSSFGARLFQEPRVELEVHLFRQAGEDSSEALRGVVTAQPLAARERLLRGRLGG